MTGYKRFLKFCFKFYCETNVERSLDWQSGGPGSHSEGSGTKSAMLGHSGLQAKIIGWDRAPRSLSNPASWVFRVVYMFSVENFQ